MSENWRPLMHIKQWLEYATQQLEAAGIESARLDAEIILDHTIRKNRTYLHAHDDEHLDPRIVEIADARLALRLDHVPIAYIIGHKEFYGRRFKVTLATLIPRPESETLIDVLKDVMPKNQTLFDEQKMRLVDVGTGSGILGITAKLEFPELDVSLVDISLPALKVAEQNAQQFHVDVDIIKSDLLANYPLKPDFIIANLPYVDAAWERSLETEQEPELALFAGDGGKALINKLIIHSAPLLKPKAIIILEADPTQHQAIIQLAQKHGLSLTRQQDYCIAFERT